MRVPTQQLLLMLLLPPQHMTGSGYTAAESPIAGPLDVKSLLLYLSLKKPLRAQTLALPNLLLSPAPLLLLLLLLKQLRAPSLKVTTMLLPHPSPPS